MASNSKRQDKNGIVFYAPGLYPCVTGGMEIYNYYLLKHIKDISSKADWSILTDCEELVEKYSNFYPIRNRVFLLRRWGLGALSTFFFYVFSNKIQWRNVKTIILPYAPGFNFSVISFLLLNFFFNVDYIVHIHSGGIDPWKHNTLLDLFMKRAKRIVGVSKTIVDNFSSKYKCHVEYLPPVLPFERTYKTKDEILRENKIMRFDKIILFLGTLKPLKGPDILLKAFSNLGKGFIKGEKLGVIMVGDGPMKKTLQEYSCDHNIESYVHFMGRVDYERVSEFYKIADIFVMASIYEGTPISLLEAMFNGLLCIGSKVEGIQDIIDDQRNGILFRCNDVEELSRKLKYIIVNSEICEKIRQNAHKYYIENFSYQAHLENVKEIIFKS